MIQLKPIEQQVAVIMGASSGIGRATALLFARRGARVVVSARGQAGLDSLVEEIRRDGGQATAVTADVADSDQVQAVAAAAIEQYGQLDTWVHLAAVSIYATFEETTMEEFRQIIDVNLIGQIHGAKAALPHLRREGRGALIHISSIEAERALPYQAAYAASKHGVKGFLETLRTELQHEGIPISVTNVMPATINTPFFNKARTRIGTKPKGLPPIYEPDVVAGAILHAAEHPQRDIYAGDAAWMISMTQKLSPKLLDATMVAVGFKGQHTDEPKDETAPDNLFGSLDRYHTIYGDFGRQALPVSPYNRLKTMNGLKVGAASLLVGAGIALVWQRLGNGS